LREVFTAFLKLGLTSFGGPIAHLGYFRDEFVLRRRWIDEAGYADIVALCQFLPGPASSQVGFVLGLRRAGGLAGGIAAWLGFTAPSAIIPVSLLIDTLANCSLATVRAANRPPAGSAGCRYTSSIITNCFCWLHCVGTCILVFRITSA
jgi:chromate transport protein ChrA